MDNLQDVRIAGRDYSGMAIAIIILSGIHVILSLVFSVMAYRKGLRKEGGAWLLSFGVCVAILVLAAVATGQKDNYGETLPLKMCKPDPTDPHNNNYTCNLIPIPGYGAGQKNTFCCLDTSTGKLVSCKTKQSPPEFVAGKKYDSLCQKNAGTQMICPPGCSGGTLEELAPHCNGPADCMNADPSADNLGKNSKKCHTEGIPGHFRCNNGCEVDPVSKCNCCDQSSGDWVGCYEDQHRELPCDIHCLNASSLSPPQCSS